MVASLWYLDNNAGYRMMQIYKNGSGLFYLSNDENHSGDAGTNASMLIDLSAGDYIELFTLQNSGGNRTVAKASIYTSFGVTYLGA